MPIYEYQCGKCGKQFEIVTMSMSEKANAVCPKCNSKKVSKMMSRFGYGKNSSSGSESASTYEGPDCSCGSCHSSSCSTCGH